MTTPLASNANVTWYYVAKYRRCASSRRGRPPHLRPASVIASRSGRDRGIILERARSISPGQKMKSLSASPHTGLHKGVQALWSIAQQAQTLGPDSFPSFIPVSAPIPLEVSVADWASSATCPWRRALPWIGLLVRPIVTALATATEPFVTESPADIP